MHSILSFCNSDWLLCCCSWLSLHICSNLKKLEWCFFFQGSTLHQNGWFNPSLKKTNFGVYNKPSRGNEKMAPTWSSSNVFFSRNFPVEIWMLWSLLKRKKRGKCVHNPPFANPDLFLRFVRLKDMGVSKNSGTPKSSILIGFSIINHPFWGTPIFGNIHMYESPMFFWWNQKHLVPAGLPCLFLPSRVEMECSTSPLSLMLCTTPWNV